MLQLSFLEGAFLWGAAAVAVPLVLHLVMRRQPQHLEFPALRFIRQRETANRRQLKLRHLLLLALRIAFIVLLAAALARPSLQGSGFLGDQEAPVAAALVFDTSPRMEYRNQNQTRLEAARDTGLWLLPQLPRDSQVAVIDARYGSSVFAVDLGAARQRIERLDVSPIGSPLAGTLDDALRLLAEAPQQRKEIYVFTDLSAASWSTQATSALKKQLAKNNGVGVYLIDVGVEQPQNFGVAGLRLSGEALSRGVPLRLQADLVHAGPAAERTIELFLSDGDGEPTQRSQQTVSFQADEAAQVDFRLGGLEPGVHQGFVRIAGADSLAADDTRYFSIEVTPAWRVLIAAPRPAEDHALFLSEALSPGALRVKGEAAFRCDVVPLDELLKAPLAEYAAVCLVDPGPLADDVWRQLADYTASGHGLAIFLGRNAAFPPAARETFNQPAAQQLLPGKLLPPVFSPDGGIYLAPEQLEHPLLAKFRPLESAIPWDAYPVYKHMQLGPLAEGAGVIIPFSNTLPAVLEKPLGRGRVITMTTPVSDTANDREGWNRIPTGEEPWPFVMLANEMLYYLAGSSHARLNYVAGETAIVRLPAGERHSIFSLQPPQGEAQRQAVDERQNAIVVSGTEQLGNYRLRAGGKDDGTSLGFSVSLPAEVSQLARATKPELAQVFGDTPFRIARGRDEIVRDVNFGRVGRELYPLLILLVVLVFMAEQLLANKFYRPGDQQRRTAAEAFAKQQKQAAEPKASEPGASAPTASEPVGAP